MQGDMYVAYNRRRSAEHESADHDALPPLEMAAAPRVETRGHAHRRRLPVVTRWPIASLVIAIVVVAMATVAWVIHANEAGTGLPTTLPRSQLIAPEKTPAANTSDLQILDTRAAGREVFRVKDAEKPALSPDRKHILFVRKAVGSDLPVPYVMDANGENQHRFVQEDSPDHQCTYSGRPAWSPSGIVAMVCMNTDKVPYPMIYLFNSAGVYLRHVPIEGVPNGFLTWVGSDSVIYVRQAANQVTSLWQVRDVLHTPGHAVSISGSWKPGSYNLPDWSSAHGLLFQRKALDALGAQSGYLGVWNMNSHQKPSEVHLPNRNRDDVFRGASWSPDGKALVFWWLPSRLKEELNWATFDDRSDTNKWHPLLTNKGVNGEPPEGKAQPAWGVL